MGGAFWSQRWSGRAQGWAGNEGERVDERPRVRGACAWMALMTRITEMIKPTS